MQVDTDVIIIGAGLSGLMAAREIQERGLSVTVLDKGSSVGGRLATRRIGDGLADYGAQFFTVRSDAFRVHVNRWLKMGLIYEWSQGWSDGSLKRTYNDGHSRYAVHGGMHALAEYIAQDVQPIRVNRQVTLIKNEADGWRIRDNTDETFAAHGVIMTPPVPQSLQLLEQSLVKLADADWNTLSEIHYGPCLCGLFEVDGETTLPEPGALQQPDAAISWIADNQRKGISPDVCLITVHGGVSFSRQHWELSDDEVLDLLQTALTEHLADDAQIVQRQLKRWRYSVPLTTHHELYLKAVELPPLIFAGDAFGGRGRVEGAVLSGLAAGRAMADALSR
ncbi:MAG: FAD-dependent oxidoreductase [Chloroflexi bacterium]|nr:MAG: NAD/FAD-dependent oxidoreductase [Phototrophicales bacterium]RMF78898.1 MAG: FAD-dependent oxidoreductase [Chloroflexota bacterium]